MTSSERTCDKAELTPQKTKTDGITARTNLFTCRPADCYQASYVRLASFGHFLLSLAWPPVP